mmetsp:Transcript_20825/g.62032  ORF Transcript_20825/g.62032 Transcript_20825/m.62032 type:complete len:488 (+) Transcript_20825:93-1556(+)
MHAAEYARAVVLERENQSLRENIHNLQHLLQVSDAEISLKHHLLLAKEQDNAQARARLQWLEVSILQAAEEERYREAANIFASRTMLKYRAGLQGAAGCPPELAHLSAKTKAEAKGLDWEDVPSVLATPSREAQKTPKGIKRGDAARADFAAPSPGEVVTPKAAAAAPSTPNGGKSKGGRGRGEPQWRPKTPQGDQTAATLTYEQAEPSPGSTGSKSSPAKKPPPLSSLDGDEEPNAQRTGATPSKGELASTPSKRMAIVDPVSGKEIDIIPKTEHSRIKPTLISLAAISEGDLARSGLVTSPPPTTSPTTPANLNGLASPPLNMPPVLPAAPLPQQAAPAALSSYGLTAPPPFAPGAGPPVPPPARPAPAVVAGSPVGASADNGAVQMARGPLAGGARLSDGYVPLTTGCYSGLPPPGAMDMAMALVPPAPLGPPQNLGTSGLLGFAGYGAAPGAPAPGGFAGVPPAPVGLTSGVGVAGAALARKH